MKTTPVCHVVLHNPCIPHNTGAIGRLCVGLGWPLHIVEPIGFDISEASVKRAGLDYWQHIELHRYRSWDDCLSAIKPKQLLVASTKGGKSIFEFEFQPGCCLLFGNEASGLPAELYERHKHELYQIPMPGQHARSLNLANATAVVMYEAYRQIVAFPPEAALDFPPSAGA